MVTAALTAPALPRPATAEQRRVVSGGWLRWGGRRSPKVQAPSWGKGCPHFTFPGPPAVREGCSVGARGGGGGSSLQPWVMVLNEPPRSEALGWEWGDCQLYNPPSTAAGWGWGRWHPCPGPCHNLTPAPSWSPSAPPSHSQRLPVSGQTSSCQSGVGHVTASANAGSFALGRAGGAGSTGGGRPASLPAGVAGRSPRTESGPRQRGGPRCLAPGWGGVTSATPPGAMLVTSHE